jgi:hydrogenase maturation protease
MNTAKIDKIANAVLYEGYMLYPYRRCVKNQQRWTFGSLYPRPHSESVGGAEPWMMQTQCLVEHLQGAKLTVEIRFLHLLDRQVARVIDSDSQNGDRNLEFVDSLDIDGVRHESWQEAIERRIDAGQYSLDDLRAGVRNVAFGYHAVHQTEPLSGAENEPSTVIVRRQEPIEGMIAISAQTVADDLSCVTVQIQNTSALAPKEDSGDRGSVQMRSLLSTHTILGVEAGGFVSLTDPPPQWRGNATELRNIGTWPVLVGDDGDRNLMLSSPIILPDYPQVAPESAGDLFDSTEIDEILALRVMTLTDEEKRQMQGLDDRTRAILQRTEKLPEEQFMKMHGAVRGLKRLASAKS